MVIGVEHANVSHVQAVMPKKQRNNELKKENKGKELLLNNDSPVGNPRSGAMFILSPA